MAINIWTGAHASFPSEWANAGNWNTIGATNRIPTSADHVYFENNAVDCDEVMDQSAFTLPSLNIDQSYTGSIGTSTAPLQVGATILNIGQHSGPGTPAGSPLINIDLGTPASTITVSNTGTSADTSRAPVRLKGTHVTNVLTVKKGKVEFGSDTDDITSKLRTVVVSYDTKVNTDADLFIGKNVALATSLTCFGGDTVIECDCPLTTVHAGTMTFTGTWAGATILNTYGGTSTLNSGAATLTNCNVYGGTVDFTKSTSARTVTNAILGAGGVIKFNSSHVTLTAGIKSADTGEVQTFTGS